MTLLSPQVPGVVVERLPQYLRALTHLQEVGLEVISSQQLGEFLQATPAQIRKDLSYFGRFGKQGRGYSIPNLLRQLRRILGLDQTWNVAVVGGRTARQVDHQLPGVRAGGVPCRLRFRLQFAGDRADGGRAARARFRQLP